MNKKEIIIKTLKESKKVIIFPHTKIDADALGSSLAVALFLTDNNIKAEVFYDDKLPENFTFLFKKYKNLITKTGKGKYDLGILIDSNSINRISKKGQNIFKTCKKNMCIDHHQDIVAEYDYSFVDNKSPSSSELVFKLLKDEIKNSSSPVDFASFLYAGIISDTGRFSYSNTTADTLMTAAKLLKLGAKKDEIYNNLFLNISLNRLKLESYIIDKMIVRNNGKLGLAILKEEDYKKFNATYDDSDAAVIRMRMLKGIELVILIKYDFKGGYKVSTRSVNYFDCNKFCSQYGGGGHKRASGFDSKLSANKLKNLIINDVYLNENL